MKLLFVRHGQTAHIDSTGQGTAIDDAVLNETGVLQAKNAGIICNEYNPVGIFCSPLQRAKQTAAVISMATAAPVAIAQDLTEFDMGDWTNLTLEETKKLFIENKAFEHSVEKYNFRVPGGESWEDVGKRAEALIKALTAKIKPDNTIIFVSHNSTIRAAVGIMRGLPFEQWFGFPLHNGGVTAFEYNGKKYKELFVDKR